MQTQSRRLKKCFMTIAVILLVMLVLLSGCTTGVKSQPEIVFGDASWDSAQIHDRIAGFIVEHGYGRPVSYIFGDPIPLLEGLSKGGVQVIMEVWYQNFQDTWQKLLDSGTVKDLGTNYPDAPQGWYVPTYVIKGDPGRGIAPLAPDLKSVNDLKKYAPLFNDPENPTKGRFYNSPPGWAVATVNEDKIAAYGLKDYYNVFSSGSGTALDTSLLTAYKQGKPWLGYYWAPTWILGKMKLTQLEEPPYDKTQWEKNHGCAYPSAPVHKAVNSNLLQTEPEIATFLEQYHTTIDQTSSALAYMQEHDGDVDATAIWFLKTYPEVWKQWVPEQVAARVSKALNEVK